MTYTMFAVETQASETGLAPRATWFGDALEWARNGARIQSRLASSAILVGIRADGTEDVLEGWFEGERSGALAPAA